jgi:septal ring factor EnvC (AmiA/AmiB activator)
VKSSLADEVEARVAARQDELLRQMADVFKELAHLSVDIGAIWRSVEGLRVQIDAQAAVLAEILDMTTVRMGVENESTEILGRLLQSARSRLDVLEEAVQNPA